MTRHDQAGSAVSEPNEALVRREMERMLASDAFEASERNRRFLRYVVEETLGGRADRIKAYSIATSVFGRGDDFDPTQDSIVRIEAARLRRAIENFYLKQGEAPEIRILIPKGAYVPAFVAGPAGAQAPAPAQTAPRPRLHDLGPRILVETLEQEGDFDRYPAIARMLTRNVIAALTRFTEVFVYGFDTTEALGARADAADRLAIDYRLLGTATVLADTLHVDLFLRRAGDGRIVWTQSFRRGLPEAAQLAGLCAEIAGDIARALALRDGILDSEARDAAGDAPSQFAGYSKLLDFQDYWRSLDPDLYQPLRRDLEATVAADPNFASALACLSMLYSNAARFGYDTSDVTDDPLGHAHDLALRAIHLAPNSSRAHHAKAIAEWFSGRTDDSLKSLQVARALNPNDPELLAELGFRHAMRMAWDVAIPMLDAAYARSPLQTGQYRMGYFFHHFAARRYREALEAVRAIQAPGIAQVHLAAAAALSGLGDMAEARQALRRFDEMAPGLRHCLREDLLLRQIHPDLVAAILDALARIDPGGLDSRPHGAADGIIPLRSRLRPNN